MNAGDATIIVGDRGVTDRFELLGRCGHQKCFLRGQGCGEKLLEYIMRRCFTHMQYRYGRCSS